MGGQSERLPPCNEYCNCTEIQQHTPAPAAPPTAAAAAAAAAVADSRQVSGDYHTRSFCCLGDQRSSIRKLLISRLWLHSLGRWNPMTDDGRGMAVGCTERRPQRAGASWAAGWPSFEGAASDGVGGI